METRDIILLLVPLLTGLISFFTSYYLSRSKSKQDISKLERSNKHDLEVLMKKFEIDLEAQKEKHKLELEMKDKDHLHALELKDKDHQNQLIQKESELENSAKYEAMGSLFGNVMQSDAVKEMIDAEIKKIKPNK